jgi:chromosome segregation ATPase
LKGAIADLELANSQLVKEFNTLAGQARAHRHTADKKMASLQSMIDQAGVEREGWATELHQCEDRFKAAKETIARLEAERDKMRQRAEGLDRRCMTHSKDMARMKERRARLEDDLEHARTSAAAKEFIVIGLKTDIHNFKAQVRGHGDCVRACLCASNIACIYVCKILVCM